MNDDFLVSICMITYNHEKYIRDAIEGVLMQQCNFKYNLVIGEDCSTDNTRKTCMEYEEKHPECITLLKQENNLGMMPNFIRTLQECTGKYIALCEGDDFWTDPYKLQKQIDFLESNAAFSACAHDLFLKQEEVESSEYEKCSDVKRIYTKHCKFINEYSIETISKGVLFQTASIVFRNRNEEYPYFFNKTKFGDLALYYILASTGKIFMMNDVMGVYRKHNGGVTALFEYKDSDSYLNNQIYLLASLNKFFNHKYYKLFNLKISESYIELAFIKLLEGKHKQFCKSIIKSCRYSKHGLLKVPKFILYYLKTISIRSYHYLRRVLRQLIKKILIGLSLYKK